VNRVNVVNLGGTFFRKRTLLPLPLIAVLLFVPARPFANPTSIWLGALVLAAGEILRLWAVNHIGAISRTRSERLGPLVTTGPFGWVRNPLYVGNVALWVGFTINTGVLWLLPPVLVLLAFEYHAIVRWEEQLLEARIGSAYREYVSRVPRWLPRARTRDTGNGEPRVRFSWRETLFSERGTLVAIAVAYLLLWAKALLLR
jgi:protein-S-isoprenylcysteine O-methyltransferase Ste14